MWRKVSRLAIFLTACQLASLSHLSHAQEALHVSPEQVPTAKVKYEVLIEGLNHPWGMAFLPQNQGILITERSGQLRRWHNQELSPPIQGTPEVFARGQGGLLDITLAPSYLKNRFVYLSYAKADASGRSSTALGYGRLSEDHQKLENFTEVFEQQPKLSSGLHYGNRIVFGPKGFLFLALGDNNQRSTAQDLDKHQGKIVRLQDADRPPVDNPFLNTPGAKPEIWSYGHRNQQGAAFNPWTHQLWTHEHGPRGGDEINIIMPGVNYGWPIVTHGINYSGDKIPEAIGESAPNMQDPVYYWPKSPAISGMAFYDDKRFPQWQHSLFIGALAGQRLIRLSLNNKGQHIIAEENLLTELGERIRDVRVGLDGYVYVLTDSSNGKLIRIEPSTE